MKTKTKTKVERKGRETEDKQSKISRIKRKRITFEEEEEEETTKLDEEDEETMLRDMLTDSSSAVNDYEKFLTKVGSVKQNPSTHSLQVSLKRT